jgi:hypothetical protein
MKNSDNTFHGVIDEVEIASTVRSPAWMNASYQSQNKPLDYIDLGDEQLLPAPPPQ